MSKSYTVVILLSTVPARFPLRELVPMLAAFGLLAWQLLVPGFIGLASNGDFPKVAGRLSIRSADDGADNFLYFQPDYLRDPRFHWDAGLPSSEYTVARTASEIERRTSDPRKFDIRWLGSVHLLAWMAGYFLLLRFLRPLGGMVWWIAVIASLWMFMDVSYVSYFNSFYMDVAALLGVMATASSAPILIAQGRRARAGIVMVFGAAALLYSTSKGQHGVFALIPTGLLILIGRTAIRKSTQVAAFTTAALLLSGSAWVLTKGPDWYRGQSRFNLIFDRILPDSAAPANDALELGLAPSDLQYVGMHSFLPGTPVASPDWLEGFTRRGSYAAVLRFYVRHPRIPIRFLWQDLRDQAPQIRALNLSNFQRLDGRPPGAKTNRMATWSMLRSWLLEHWPVHMLMWYALVLLGSPSLVLRGSRFGRAVGWSLMLAALMGLGEFCVASLGDCLETYRHLLLFHLFTDFTIFFAIVLGLHLAPSLARQHVQSHTSEMP